MKIIDKRPIIYWMVWPPLVSFGRFWLPYLVAKNMRPEDPGNEVASEHARVFEHAHEQWREITFIFPVISSFPVVPEVVPKARDTKYCKFFCKIMF